MKLILEAAPAVKALKSASIVIVDTETSSLYPWRDGRVLAGIGVKPLDGPDFYLPVRHKNGGKQAPLGELKKLCEALRGKILVFHNAKFDLAVLWQEGIDLSDEEIEDTLVLIRLISEDERSYELKKLADKYVDPNASKVQKALKKLMKKMGWETYDQVPAEQILSYVKGDLTDTEGLYNRAIPFIEKRNLEELWALEKTLLKKLFHIEREGFLTDPKYIEREHKLVTAVIEDLEARIKESAMESLRARAKELKIGKLAKKWLELKPRERDVNSPKLEGKLGEDMFQEFERLVEIHGLEAVKKYLVGFICFREARKVGTSKFIEENEFDVMSSHDVRKIFEALGIRSDVKTKKGGDSWAKSALAVVDHPMADMVVKCRGAYSVRNYYKNFKELMDDDALIHCSLHQSGTRTGRLSCREPNLQNVPKFEGYTGSIHGALASMKKLAKRREEIAEKKKRYAQAGKKQIAFDDEVAEEVLSELESELFGKVRGSFIPRPGNFLLSIDWSQVELRIFADYANEDELLRTFDLGLDVHRMTALAAFGSLPDPEKNEQMYKWVRNMGKQISFGLLYGMGISLLSIEIQRSKDEAQEFMDRYFARFKNAKKWIDETNRQCEKNGFVANRWGRRRYLGHDKAYKSVNFLVQGTAADLMKDALIRTYYALEPYKTRILLTVHDELIFDVPYEEAEAVVPIIVHEMTTCDRIKAKLRCDVEWSPKNWAERHKLECDQCAGKGQTAALPGVPDDKVEDIMLNALYENNVKLLRSAEIIDCAACDGRGYDLTKIKKPRRKKAA